MAKNDDLFDDLWDDQPPKSSPAPKGNTPSQEDWDFLGDGSPPPKKKSAKKVNPLLWLIPVALLVIFIATRLPQTEPQPSQPSVWQPTPQSTTPALPTVPPSTTQLPTQPTIPQATQPGVTQPTQPTVPTRDPQPYRYLRQLLSSQEQQLFDQVLSGLETVSGSIGPLNFSSKQSLEAVMEAVWYDCPEVFWYNGSYSYDYFQRQGYMEVTLKPNYHWNSQQSLSNKAFVDQTLQPLISQLSGCSDYDKVMGVHEYLIDRTAYTPAYRGTTMYEALRDKKAVCEGYARVTQYLMNQLGIPVIYVSGVAVNSAGKRDTHSWNLVQVDGAWYLLDVTWDDPYFEDGRQEKLYTYFCVTTEEMNRNHVSDLNIFPNCTATAANYHIRQDRYLTSYDTATLQRWLSESAQSRELSFKCANQATYTRVMQMLQGQELFTLAEQAQVSIPQFSYSYDQIFYVVTVTW